MTESQPTDWHLICITRNGKVSILKNLDLRTARETYKKLQPETRPKEYIYPECSSWSWSGGGFIIYESSNDDKLDKVEAIGPEGVDLDPWFGVEPQIIDLAKRHALEVRSGHVRCECAAEAAQEDPDDARLRKLYRDVPTAFWLEPTHA